MLLFSQQRSQLAELKGWSRQNAVTLRYHARMESMFANVLLSLDRAPEKPLFVVLDASHPEAPKMAAPLSAVPGVKLILWTRRGAPARAWWSEASLRIESPGHLEALSSYVRRFTPLKPVAPRLQQAVHAAPGRREPARRTASHRSVGRSGGYGAVPRAMWRASRRRGQTRPKRSPRRLAPATLGAGPETRDGPVQVGRAPESELPRVGKLGDLSQAELLCRLYEHRVSGELLVWVEGGQYVVEVRAGLPVSIASSQAPPMPLEELLVEMGAVTAREVEWAAARARRGRVVQTLLRTRAVSGEEVRQAEQLQLQGSLRACLERTGALYTLKQQPSPPTGGTPLALITYIASLTGHAATHNLGASLAPTRRLEAFLPLLREHFAGRLPLSWWERFDEAPTLGGLLSGLSNTLAAREAVQVMLEMGLLDVNEGAHSGAARLDDGARVGALGPGDVVASRYEIQAPLGEGATSIVYQALDLELNEPCALKVLHAESLQQRFKQELTISRRLNHPHIISIYNIGAYRGQKFLSMELLEGETLDQRITRGVPPLEEGIAILRMVVEGLMEAHRQGVIHRDLKPANIFLTDDGGLKLMDFGLAKVPRRGLTRAGFSAGSPVYMAPEQIQSFRDVSPATDYYALGVIAYELFTGSTPFSASDLTSLLLDHLSTPPPRPGALVLALPPELERLTLDLLEKAPEDRPQGGEVLERLAEAARVL